MAKRDDGSLKDTLVAATHDAQSPTPGSMFAGRYRVERQLGRGGMGAVYRAMDTLVGDVVALKTLELGQSPSVEAIERFRREVRLARRVSHPNVARTHDLGEVNGVHYLTMELIEGQDLEHHIATAQRLSPTRAAQIAIGIADGLAAAHAAGIVHRDLKPGNVLIESATGRIVLTDFGIARGAVDPAQKSQTVGTVGTPIYMAPEQVRGGPVDGRTDVYALGLVLYEMLTGTEPFVGDTPLAAAVARLDAPPPDPRAVIPVDDTLATIVMRCLAHDPAQRPGSAAEVAQLLRATGLSAPMSVPDPSRPALSSPLPRSVRTPSLTGYRTLAVLPVRYRGPKEHDYLGEAITELVDVLSRTHGLRVVAAGATRRFAEDRDPQTVGLALGCDVLVDATLQLAGEGLRITVRLIDVSTAEVLISERFDTEMADVLEVQDTISRRVAEALRVTLDIGATRLKAPAGAIEAYMRGRRALSSGRQAGVGSAHQHFEEALALAPDFAAAKAAHAVACMRAWFVPGSDPSVDWPTVAKASVERAVAEAPNVAETHIAASQMALERGEFRTAVHALTRALDIAPTLPQVHTSLGILEIEAGRPEKGRKRLKLALELDPSSPFAPADLARSFALHGENEKADAVLAKVSAPEHPAALNVRMRIATWRGDRSALEQVLSVCRGSTLPVVRFTQIACEAVLGIMTTDALEKFLAGIPVSSLSPRFVALLHQVAAEAFLAAKDPDRAAVEIARSAEAWLIDLEWLDHCTLLAPLGGSAQLEEARRIVRTRAEAIWSASA